MNTDPRFARARIRRIMPLLAANGIDPAGLAATARRLVSSAEAIDQGATHLVAEAVVIDDLASAHLDADRFFSSASEVSNRALVRLLLAIGGDLFPPRFERLCALADDMRSHVAPARFKRTLSGCIVEYRRGGFLIYRETGRAGLPEIRIAPGFEGIWDHRFVVKIGDGAPQGLDLGALGPDGRREAGLRSDIAPPGVLEALPALKRNGRLLAAPGYRLDGCRWAEIQPIVARRAAEPPIFPDFLSGGASGAFTLP